MTIRLTANNPWPSDRGKYWSWTCPECWHLIATQPTRDRAVNLVRLHIATHGPGWRLIDEGHANDQQDYEDRLRAGLRANGWGEQDDDDDTQP